MGRRERHAYNLLDVDAGGRVERIQDRRDCLRERRGVAREAGPVSTVEQGHLPHLDVVGLLDDSSDNLFKVLDDKQLFRAWAHALPRLGRRVEHLHRGLTVLDGGSCDGLRR